MRWMNLFQRFRDLEARVEFECSARSVAEAEVSELREKLMDALREKSDMQTSMLKQNEKFTDWVAQSQGRPPIFGNRFEIESKSIELSRSTKRQARDIVAEAEHENKAEMMRQLNSLERDLGIQ